MSSERKGNLNHRPDWEDPRLLTCVEAVTEAGRYIRNRGHFNGIVRTKEDLSLVTDTDQEAEAIVVRTIRSRFSDHTIVGEEEGIHKPTDSPWTWYVDPVDGTHNYVRNLDAYGVSVGVMKGAEFYAGALYFPATDELYYALTGRGARKNGHPLRISGAKSLKDCYLAFDSSFQYAPDLMSRTLAKLSTEVFNIRITGSTARNLAYLAEGKMDLSLEFTVKPWDFAGGIPIVREAGAGVRSLWKNDPPFSAESRSYMVGPPHLLDQLQNLMDEILRTTPA